MSDQNKILVIDDDDIFLYTASFAINQANPNVSIITSNNGEDALTKAESFNPKAIFVDLNMPIMSGWEFLDELAKKDKWYSVPIVIVTSSIDWDDKQRAKNHPLKPSFVEKPLSADKIRQLDIPNF